MSEDELIESINRTIIGLEEHFVIEDCEGVYSLGCASCHSFRVIQDLKSLLELISE